MEHGIHYLPCSYTNDIIDLCLVTVIPWFIGLYEEIIFSELIISCTGGQTMEYLHVLLNIVKPVLRSHPREGPILPASDM